MIIEKEQNDEGGSLFFLGTERRSELLRTLRSDYGRLVQPTK